MDGLGWSEVAVSDVYCFLAVLQSSFGVKSCIWSSRHSGSIFVFSNDFKRKHYFRLK